MDWASNTACAHVFARRPVLASVRAASRRLLEPRTRDSLASLTRALASLARTSEAELHVERLGAIAGALSRGTCALLYVLSLYCTTQWDPLLSCTLVIVTSCSV